MTPFFLTAATEAPKLNISFDTIKGLLETKDPGEMLPEMSALLEKITLLCRIAVLIGPVLLLLLGLSYLFLAPKEANYYLGFRCYFGMGSVHAWRFTQRIAGLLFCALGALLLVIAAIRVLGFSHLEPEAMVWAALHLLIWQAALSLLATCFISALAAHYFDRKGQLRRRKHKK